MFHTGSLAKVYFTWRSGQARRLTGGIVPRVKRSDATSREDFYSLLTLCPSLEVQRAFVQYLNPCWARQEQNARHSSTLDVVRDALLPKLISGELRVKNAERMAGATV
jgi:hypothetical protein